MTRQVRFDQLADCVQFMMDFELKLEKPGRRQAYISALVMGLAYFIGRCIQADVFDVMTDHLLQGVCYQ